MNSASSDQRFDHQGYGTVYSLHVMMACEISYLTLEQPTLYGPDIANPLMKGLVMNVSIHASAAVSPRDTELSILTVTAIHRACD